MESSAMAAIDGKSIPYCSVNSDNQDSTRYNASTMPSSAQHRGYFTPSAPTILSNVLSNYNDSCAHGQYKVVIESQVNSTSIVFPTNKCLFPQLEKHIKFICGDDLNSLTIAYYDDINCKDSPHYESKILPYYFESNNIAHKYECGCVDSSSYVSYHEYSSSSCSINELVTTDYYLNGVESDFGDTCEVASIDNNNNKLSIITSDLSTCPMNSNFVSYSVFNISSPYCMNMGSHSVQYIIDNMPMSSLFSQTSIIVAQEYWLHGVEVDKNEHCTILTYTNSTGLSSITDPNSVCPISPYTAVKNFFEVENQYCVSNINGSDLYTADTMPIAAMYTGDYLFGEVDLETFKVFDQCSTGQYKIVQVTFNGTDNKAYFPTHVVLNPELDDWFMLSCTDDLKTLGLALSIFGSSIDVELPTTQMNVTGLVNVDDEISCKCVDSSAYITSLRYNNSFTCDGHPIDSYHYISGVAVNSTHENNSQVACEMASYSSSDGVSAVGLSLLEEFGTCPIYTDHANTSFINQASPYCLRDGNESLLYYADIMPSSSRFTGGNDTDPLDLLPTPRPTVKPGDPTPFPTSVPTSSPPTAIPTSSVPTSQPSSSPSMQPTTQPTTQPSSQPSSYPSGQPSGQPTSVPSAQPSSQPSSVPSAQPSSQPSAQPSTQPSSVPTSEPSWNIQDYTESPIYNNYTLTLNTTQVDNPQLNAFGSFLYKGSYPHGTCNDWNTYYRGDLFLPFDYLYIKGATVYYQYHHIPVLDRNDGYSGGNIARKTCSDRTKVNNMLDALNGGYTFNMTCEGSKWQVFGCTGNMALCIDCDLSENYFNSSICSTYPNIVCSANTTNSLTGDSHGGIVINPCASCDNRYHDAFVTLGWELGEDILYPEISGAPIIVPNKTTLDVTLNITKTGTVYCGYFGNNEKPSSVLDVIAQDISTMVLTKGNITLTMTGLVPDTDYKIFCYTEDFENHLMDLPGVLATASNASTSCCKALSYTAFVGTRFNDSIDQYSFALDALPSVDTTFDVILTPTTPCDYTEGALAMSAVARKESFNFGPTSLSLSSTFIIYGTPGCYQVTTQTRTSRRRRQLFGRSRNRALSGGDIYDSAIDNVILRSHKSNADPPLLKTARFTRNPSKIILYFDSATDRGAESGGISNPAGIFDCEELFTVFAGSSTTKCLFNKNTDTGLDVVIMTLGKGDSDGSNVIIGTTIALKAGIVRPCVACCPLSNEACNYAISQSVDVDAPLNPLKPTTALSTSAEIGECANIVLDPSQSSGHGGRDWESIQWELEAYRDDVAMDVVASNMTNYLNNNFQNTKQRATILNKFLKDLTGLGTQYTISLTLENFLLQKTRVSSKVTVKQVAKQPVVSINGKSKVSKLRANKLTLFAIGSVPKCEDDTSTETDSLSYSWKVYIGARYVSTLISTSKDPRFFKLDGYTLESNTIYTVAVVASLEGARATSTVTVAVGSAGVVAGILGGAKRSGSTTQDMVFESSSYDIDYPTDDSDLRYTWACSEVSPNYGDDCPATISGADLSTATITSNTFTRAADATYTITLYVEKISSGDSASASTEIEMVSSAIPKIAFGAVESKYNPTEKIILSSTVSAIDAAAVAWTCTQFTDSEMNNLNLTPLNYNVPSGDTIAELAIKANVLVAGASYTFIISSNYISSTKSKYEEVTIIINSAPSGGSVDVTPLVGVTMDTDFYFSTFDWQDDPDDYPITYVMWVYSDPTSSTIVKTAGETTYTFAKIEQGLEEQEYNVTSVAEASDLYGAAATTSILIKVQPETDTSKLESSMNTGLDDAFANSDPVAVSQVINAVTASMNAANCTTPVPCADINRTSCKNTPLTCGACLTGYLGVNGDSNQMCVMADTVNRIGEACAISMDCVSNNCQSDGICGPFQNKSCPSDCLGKGNCVFYSHITGSAISSCSEDDKTCYATCECNTDWFGSDCGLPLANYTRAQNMRDSLCNSIYKTVAIQDAASDVVQSRCTTLSKLLLDSTQLTNYAIVNCTRALIETVSTSPTYVGMEGVSDLVSDALSAVLLLDLEQSLLDDVSSSLETLTESVQDTLAVGEAQKNFNTPSMRAGAQVVDPNNLGTVTPPQDSSESFNNQPISSFSVTPGGGDEVSALGVSVVQYNNNPYNASTDTTPVGMQLATFGTANRRRRLLQTGENHFDRKSRWRRRRLSTTNTVDVVLINSEAKSYFPHIPQTTGKLKCNISLNANHTVNTTCPMRDMVTKELYYTNITLYCEPFANKSMAYTCPEFINEPSCSTYDASVGTFAADGNCVVSSYTAWNTTCTCTVSTTASRRKLGVEQTAKSELKQFSSSASIIGDTFTSTINTGSTFADTDDGDDEFSNSAGAIGGEDAKKAAKYAKRFAKVAGQNAVVSITMGCVLSFTLAGLCMVSYKDRGDYRRWLDKMELEKPTRDKREAAKDVIRFFNDAMPYEFSGLPWYVRWWKKIIDDHEWLAMFLPYTPERNFAYIRFTTGMTRIINFLFVDTILAGLFFVDTGACGVHTNEKDCTFVRSLSQIEPLCVYNFDHTGWYNASQTFNRTGYIEIGTTSINASLYTTPIDVPKELFALCEFNQIGTEFFPMLILVVLITIFTIPFDKLTDKLIAETESFLSGFAEKLEHQKEVEKELAEAKIQRKASIMLRSPYGKNKVVPGLVGERESGSGNNLELEDRPMFNLDNIVDDDKIVSSPEPSPIRKIREGEDGEEGDKTEYHLYVQEIRNCQSFQGTILRAARLEIMRKRMDEKTPGEEAYDLTHGTESHHLDLHLAKSKEDIALKKETSLMNRIYQWGYNLYLNADDHGDGDAGAKIVIAERVGGYDGVVLKSILKARERCDDILEHMTTLETDADRDSYLLQRFIIDSMNGLQRRVAMRFVEENEEEDELHMRWRMLYFIALIMWVVLVSGYVFLFGVMLGPTAANSWLTGVGLAMIQDFFILQPFKIFLMYIIIAGVPAIRIRVVHTILKKHARNVLNRTNGLIRDAGALIQHFNPACRAARMYPHLSMSRILMSLNDMDIPLSYVELERSTQSAAVKVIAFIGLVISGAVLIILILLPEILGDSIIETSITLVFNLLIAAMVTAAEEVNVFLPVVFSLVLIAYITYKEMQKHYERMENKWQLKMPVVPLSKEIDDMDQDELDLLPILDIKLKELANLTWKAKLQSALNSRKAIEAGETEATSLLDSVLSEKPTLRSKNLPSINSLITKGILPDIFSSIKSDTDDNKVDLDSPMPTSIARKYAKRDEALNLNDLDSPLDAVRQIEAQWSNANVNKNPNDRFRRAFNRFSVIRPNIRKDTHKLATSAIGEQKRDLLSLFDDRNTETQLDEMNFGELDLPTEISAQEQLDIRRKRRQKRRALEDERKAKLAEQAISGHMLDKREAADHEAQQYRIQQRLAQRMGKLGGRVDGMESNINTLSTGNPTASLLTSHAAADAKVSSQLDASHEDSHEHLAIRLDHRMSAAKFFNKPNNLPILEIGKVSSGGINNSPLANMGSRIKLGFDSPRLSKNAVYDIGSNPIELARGEGNNMSTDEGESRIRRPFRQSRDRRGFDSAKRIAGVPSSSEDEAAYGAVAPNPSDNDNIMELFQVDKFGSNDVAVEEQQRQRREVRKYMRRGRGENET
jgi:hypothetical protein